LGGRCVRLRGRGRPSQSDERAARANQLAANGVIEASTPQRFRGVPGRPGPRPQGGARGRALSGWVFDLEFLGHPRCPAPKKFGGLTDARFCGKSADAGGTLIGLRGLFRL